MLFSVLNVPLLLCVLLEHTLGWDPDAGLVKSWTKLPGVSVTATSGKNAQLVVDDNDDTHWQSGACLPQYYINRAQENGLLGLCASTTTCHTTSNSQSLEPITDGKVYTSSLVAADANSVAKVTLVPASRVVFGRITVWGIYKSVVTLKAYDAQGGATTLRSFNSTDNYNRIAITSLPNKPIHELVLESAVSFTIKEISAFNASECIERIVVDLGSTREIGVVRHRHWAGKNTASRAALLMSTDGLGWDTITSLQPEALRPVTTRLSAPKNYRYIAIEYGMYSRDYNKVYCWEIDAYDKFGTWGPPPAPKVNPFSLRQILGVNGIWGWGHKMFSNLISAGDGPTLYNKVASHARNYHNLDWDVEDPDYDPQFDKMDAGGGTNGSWWLDWDQEYNAWVSANLTVDASIQFTYAMFNDSVWDSPESSAFNYGREFARHFGPQIGNGLVSSMEVGNEPWHYNSTFYAPILASMAAGARSVDESIDILPAAFQADTKPPSEPSPGNYIGSRVLENAAKNISVINAHAYSFVVNESGVRIASHPEHPDSSFNSLRNMIRWRNVNTPSKPVWLTEWGWDAGGKQENCTFSECVTEQAQAIYGVRGLFITYRLGIEKAMWYFYANTYCDHLFCRSGLTTTADHTFTKKAVFHAFEAVLNKIGDKHFIKALSEDESGYIYLFGVVISPVRKRKRRQTLGNVEITHIVAWLPVDVADDLTQTHNVNFTFGRVPLAAWRLTGLDSAITSDSVPSFTSGQISLQLSSKPLIVEMGQEDIVIGK